MRPAPPTVSAADLHYPPELPIVARKDEIARAIAEHQVLVIAGETGSGKTTQLPKIALEAGRGRGGRIGHTQPRRIAARAVAERIAQELGEDLGGLVGYQVRLTDVTSADTVVKVMTDGILLAELARDRDLTAYDTLIIDEAHERSLNIDVILGYLKALLPRRPDLRVIITSATIDPGRFADHFAIAGRPAPVIEVSGRTYPVEVRYRPLLTPDGVVVDQVTGICAAVEELWTQPHPGPGGSDILVFLSGEREIRDTADAITAMNLPGTSILPLYSRLSAAEQHRVFRSAPGRRIVLATNVAETSLTVPGIRYVIDAGTARISRYSQRTKVQRLPIEPISQASATQRAGRCGRLADGICIRLYTEDDFAQRPRFTEPEILRTSVASVLLMMIDLRLGDVARFPFIDPPDRRQISDGMRLLEELGAIRASDGRRRPGLTRVGRRLARLPVDLRLGRMLLEADARGCTEEVLVIVSALSIQDPRERPEEFRAQADQAHARHRDPRSDFLSYLRLWRYLQEQQRLRSGSGFRRMCREEYLHYLRVREWQDLLSQLRRSAREIGLDVKARTAAPGADPDPDTIHRAILSGLLSHIGVKDERTRDYLGARGAHFAIAPGSALFRRSPDVVMAGELVETSRLWAREVAGIEAAWAEEAAGDLAKRSYSEPRWSRSRAAAVATEKVTLYGVPLVADRVVQLGKVDPESARESFIRHALIEGDWDTRHDFFRENQATVRAAGDLAERARRHDILADDSALFGFYDDRLPPHIVSGAHFDSWFKQVRRGQPELLRISPDLLLAAPGADAVDREDFPSQWRSEGQVLDLEYAFEPGADHDGVTVTIPLAVLNQVSDPGLDWQIPGRRLELVTALLRALPKPIRRQLAPVPDFAKGVIDQLDPAAGGLTDELARVIAERTGARVAPEDWDLARVPDHLKVSYSVVDGARVVGTGKDLAALRRQLAGASQASVRRAAAGIERTGLTSFDLDQLPASFFTEVEGREVVGYPALVDTGSAVDLRVLTDQATAEAVTRIGVRRLILRAVPPPWKRVLASLSNADKLAIADNPYGSIPALLDDALSAAVDSIVSRQLGRDVRTRADFEDAVSAVRAHLATEVLAILRQLPGILALAAAVRDQLALTPAPHLSATWADAKAHREDLLRAGFLTRTGVARLDDLRRYLKALQVRLTRAVDDPARDRRLLAELDPIEAAYADLISALEPIARQRPDVVDIGWLIEELRVGLFAQALGTSRPVSAKRATAAIHAARQDLARGGNAAPGRAR